MFANIIYNFIGYPFFKDSLSITFFAKISYLEILYLIMMRIILFAFLLVIICSCSRKSAENKSDSIIKIDLLSEPVSTVEKLSEFADNIEYIPLQTVKGSLLSGNNAKIVKKDKRIYIENSILYNNEILCFTTEGKFLYKIDKGGRGPEEYTNIADFDVSSDNKFMIILSSLIHKLFVYDISDTGFIFRRSIALKDPAPYRVCLVPKTNNAFLAIPPWRGTEPTLSLLINTAGDTIYYKPNTYKYQMVGKMNFAANNEMLVYSVGETVCFKEEFSDTIFYIDSNVSSFKPRIILDSHGTLTTPAIRGGSEPVRNNITYIPNIFETSRYVFCYYGTMDNRDKIIYDKKTKIKYNLTIEKEYKQANLNAQPYLEYSTKLEDDLSGGPDFEIDFLGTFCTGGNLFSFVEAIELKKYADGPDFKNARVIDPKKKNELKKLADSLCETDNPVLIIVTPKE